MLVCKWFRPATSSATPWRSRRAGVGLGQGGLQAPGESEDEFGELDRFDARVGGADRAGEHVAHGSVVRIDHSFSLRS
ncbi:MAG: hypothetical protein M3332_15985 [Actinomycetota bacterium]|nr:hypothetical protein [Actinomycetota bacterium]